jgi:phosphocarrier protein
VFSLQKYIEAMQTRTATIANAQGIHCRPSAVIVKEFLGYPGTIRLSNSNGVCDVSSVLQLLSLEMTQGNVVRVEVEGPDEAAKADRVVELLETHFDFPPLS